MDGRRHRDGVLYTGKPSIRTGSVRAGVRLRESGVMANPAKSPDELIHAGCAPNTRVLVIPKGVVDKRSFFAAVRDSLPFDPPLESQILSWDALEDSLWSGLCALEETNLAIVWSDAGEMRSCCSAEFEVAKSTLESIATTLAQPQHTRYSVKHLVIVLGGDSCAD